MTRLLLAFSLLLSPSAFAAVDIGVASAVRGKVSGAAPGAAGRVVETGKPVYQNDKITTGPDAKLQILLLDETSFTVGPNSEMTLDEFVFDPATNAGKVGARIAKGTFRFITGKVARKDPDSMKVKLAVGTIGIRGTMVAGQTSETEATVVLLGPGLDNNADEKGGAITVGNEKGSVDVDQDGWGVNMKAGEAPGDPFKVPAGQLDGILSGVASAPQGDSTDSGTDGAAAGEDSGQDTASGNAMKADAFAALDAEQGETRSFASQQGLSGVSTWDLVRGITSGSGKFQGSAPMYNFTSGNQNPVGTMNFNLMIDFGARTMGGGGAGFSDINLGSPAGATGTINQFSYANLTGDAVVNLAPHISGAGTWTGTTLKLENAGGVAAGAASIDVRWNTGVPPTYGGVVTGPLQ